MAKDSKKTNGSDGAGATVTIQLPADFSIEAHGFSITASQISEMGPKGAAYLFANGFKQSITDAAAFTKEQKAGKSEAEVATMAQEKRQGRYDDILSGNVGSVSGTRGTTLERAMKDVAVERIKALCASKGIPMVKNTKEAKNLDITVDKYINKYRDDVLAEANARMASAKAAASVAEDILG